MFTGLVEKVSIVKEFLNTADGAQISFEYKNDDVKLGDSIAVNGVCLTVSKIEGKIITADVMKQTLSVTNLKNLKSKDKINIEPAMKMTSRLDGHIVQGHVDNIGMVSSIVQDGFSKRITFETDTTLVIEKGSIAINGVSLTVSKVQEGFVEVSLIPSTLDNTNLQDLKIGDGVNIEYDVIGKYLYKFINQKPKFKITEEFLKTNGF